VRPYASLIAVIVEALLPAPFAAIAALMSEVVAPALVAIWPLIVVVPASVMIAVMATLQPEPEADG
jgi:hypothetical protein